ncbi:MAG TPA: lysylphosphatidylglycerol synthase transmembrane domain-containing protein [Thermaerobacter sp.]
MTPHLRTILSWIVLAGLVAAALVTVSPADVARLAAFAARQPALTALAVTAYATAFALRAVAWGLLLPGTGVRLPFATLWRLTLVANLVNHLAPGKLGEVVRVVLAERQGLPRPVAVASVVHARLVDTVALLAVAAPALARSLAGTGRVPVPGPGRESVPGSGPGPVPGGPEGSPALPPGFLEWPATALLAGGVGLAALLALRMLGPRLARRWPALDTFTRPVTEVPAHRLAAAFLAAAASWPLEAGILAVVSGGLGISLDPAALVAVTLVAVAGQVIAITPGGLGTYEANMTLILQLYGVPPATAFRAGLFTHLAKYLFAAAGLEPAWRLAGGPGRLLGTGRSDSSTPVRHAASHQAPEPFLPVARQEVHHGDL